MSRASGITVVIVSYFTGPLLERSLTTARDQDGVEEIILVDNGNWPGAAEEAIAAAKEAAPGGPDIVLVQGQGNVGFAAACNLGVARARTSLLLFLNPDAVLTPGAAQALVDHVGVRAEPWVVAPKLVNPDGAEQQGSRRAILTPWRAFIEATRLYKLAPNHPYFRRFNLHNEPCPDDLTEVQVISGACFLVPKDDYERIGGMDERYFLHVEDVDFCLRFARAGGVILFDPNVRVVHFKSSSRVGSLKVEARKISSTNKYFRTHFADPYPPGFLLIVAAALWTMFGLKLAAAAVRGALASIGLRSRRGGDAVRRAQKISANKSSR